MSSARFKIPLNAKIDIDTLATVPAENDTQGKDAKKALKGVIKNVSDLQRKLYAGQKQSVLLIFQAMDAAGKDSTIRHVLSGVNPAGCHVTSFKAPSTVELAHDFLWRSTIALPAKGMIGVFNRSYYEEVLAVKVNKDFLAGQNLPSTTYDNAFWQSRYESINDHEKHLTRQGTIIIKFWLNVSKDEQKNRLLSRINDLNKNWKFEASDLTTRSKWGEYMRAYEQMLSSTSSEHAPWYAIPADDKPFMRLSVANIILEKLNELNLAYPALSIAERNELKNYQDTLLSE